MKIRSKRHGRIRSLQDAEFDSPYFEVILDGKRTIGLEDVGKSEGIPLLRLPVSVLHSKIARSETLLKYYSKLLNNPERYENISIYKKEIMQINIRNLIIGCGTSGLSLLEELSDDNVLTICHKEYGYVEMDNSADPLLNKREIINKLRDIYKVNSEKVIKGIFLGRFDEGLVFDIGDKFLIINPERVFLASGSRYILPLFDGNDSPKVISRNLFLLNKQKYKRIIVLGSSDDALKTALNAENAIILYKEGATFFSKFYLEEIEKRGYEIVGVNRLRLVDDHRGVFVMSDKGEWYADVIVYAIVKQPKIEISSNLGIPYTFFDPLHVYLPSHDIVGRAKDSPNVFLLGGIRGISLDSLSYFSAKHILGKDNDFVNNLKVYEPYLYRYYDSKTNGKGISPYLFNEGGYVCECEDILFDDIREAIEKGYNNVEQIKRVTGLATGSCQGKICSFLAGSIMNSEGLITFRSPLYRLVA